MLSSLRQEVVDLERIEREARERAQHEQAQRERLVRERLDDEQRRHEAAAAAEASRRADEAIASARAGFARGWRLPAIKQLETFAPPHPRVTEALAALRADLLAGAAAAAEKALAEDRIDDAFDALFEAERSGAVSERLADLSGRAQRAEDEIRRVSQLLGEASEALEREDLTSASRLSEAALKVRPGHAGAQELAGRVAAAVDWQRARARVRDAVANAEHALAAGRLDDAILALEAIGDPLEPPERERVRSMLEDARARKTAAAAARRREDEQRALEEERRREDARQREQAERQALEARRQEEERRRQEAARPAAQPEAPPGVTRPEAISPPAAHRTPAWLKRPVVATVIVAAALSATALLVWFGRSGTSGPPPDPLATIVSQAQAEYRAGNRPAAVETILNGLRLQPGHQPLVDVLAVIRRDAMEPVDSARARAVAAGAEASDDFRAAESRRAEADRLSAPADTLQALSAYDEVARLYDRAGTSVLSVQELLKRARQALSGQQLRNAVTYAEQVIAKEPTNRDGRQILQNIRANELLRAREARAGAVSAGATEQPTFSEGDVKLGQATALGERETWRQVVLFGEAVQAFDAAVGSKKIADAKEAEEIRKRAGELLGQARASLAAGNLQQAQDEVKRSIGLADTPEARQALSEIDSAIKEDDARRAALTTLRANIGKEIKAAITMPPAQAIEQLQSLQARAAAFPDLLAEVETELARARARLGKDNAGGRGAGGGTGKDDPRNLALEVDRQLIEQLFQRYVEAYRQLNEGAVRAIDPSADTRSFPLLNKVQLTVSDLAIHFFDDGRTAELTARQTFVYDWRRSGGKPRSDGDLRWNLRKEGTTWRVVPR
jgi:hypothetical protein